MNLHDDAVRTLSQWQPPDQEELAGQQLLIQDYLEFLREHDDAMQRSCEPGHLTASVLVLSADRQHTLLTLHPKVGRWLQLGGHCEPSDSSLAAAALREGQEESGLAGLQLTSGQPVRLDRHRVGCHGGSQHLDVQYAAIATTDADPVMSDESLDLRWWPVGALPADSDHALRALVRVATRQPD